MREVRRAIELSPSDTDAHSFYSTLLCFVGHNSEAMREVQYALKLNPAALLANQYTAWMYSHMGQHARAEAQARRTIELFPDSLQPHFVLEWSAWYQGRAEDAVAALEKALSHSREALSLSYLGHVYGRLGRTDEAMRLFRELEQLRAQGHAPPIAFAVIHAGLGDIDAAFDWLETAYRLPGWLPVLAHRGSRTRSHSLGSTLYRSRPSRGGRSAMAGIRVVELRGSPSGPVCDGIWCEQ
jgi:adenylate cyclase